MATKKAKPVERASNQHCANLDKFRVTIENQVELMLHEYVPGADSIEFNLHDLSHDYNLYGPVGYRVCGSVEVKKGRLARYFDASLLVAATGFVVTKWKEEEEK
jgi:hypothetical protein